MPRRGRSLRVIQFSWGLQSLWTDDEWDSPGLEAAGVERVAVFVFGFFRRGDLDGPLRARCATKCERQHVMAREHVDRSLAARERQLRAVDEGLGLFSRDLDVDFLFPGTAAG